MPQLFETGASIAQRARVQPVPNLPIDSRNPSGAHVGKTNQKLCRSAETNVWNLVHLRIQVSANPFPSVSLHLSRLFNVKPVLFSCETRYDGERAQVQIGRAHV